MKKHISIKKSEGTKETVQFHIYSAELSDALISAKLFDADLWEEKLKRINSMWVCGEPLWMAYTELELIFRKSIDRKGFVENENPMDIARKYGRVVNF